MCLGFFVIDMRKMAHRRGDPCLFKERPSGPEQEELPVQWPRIFLKTQILLFSSCEKGQDQNLPTT